MREESVPKIADMIWSKLKREYVDEWQPTEEDVKWLVRTVGGMKVGALWHILHDGVTFKNRLQPFKA